jgi:hypothetical protein
MEICPKAETPVGDQNTGVGQIITASPGFVARIFGDLLEACFIDEKQAFT